MEDLLMFNQMLLPSALAIGNFSAETVTMAWQTLVLGMGMIFAVLALLWGVLAIFKLVFAGKNPKAIKVPKAPKAPKAPKPDPIPTPEARA